MIPKDLVAGLRRVRRHKGFSALTIAGLAAGMACVLLILLYVGFERSYDRFHERGDDIFLCARENVLAGGSELKGITGAPLAPLLLRNIPEVEAAVRFTAFRGEFVGRGPARFLERGWFFADASVFEVFSFPLERGDAATALREPLSVVVSAETARKYFGDEPPLGGVLSYVFGGRSFDFKVSGVLKPLPRNSHLRFDFLASYASLSSILGDNAGYFLTRHWDSPTWTYVKLGAGSNPDGVNRRLAELSRAFVDRRSALAVSHRLVPLREVYFDAPGPPIGARGDRRLVRTLSAVAFLIILIACVNFMNLSTARAELRAREIGLRKVVGASRPRLVRQLLGEAVILSLFAAVCGLAGAALLLPSFAAYVGSPLAARDLLGGGFLAATVLTALGTGLLAGAYPAFVLASLRPERTLGRAGRAGRSGLAMRRVLVTGQFALSIALIAGSLLTARQVRFLRTMDVGFQKENVLVVPVRDGAVRRRYETLKSRWLAEAGVLGVTASSMRPGVDSQNGISLRARGNPDVDMGIIYVDPDYVRTFGIPIVRGRDFERGSAADAAGALLVNETAVKRLGWTDGIGEPVELFFKEGGRIEPVARAVVVGVVADFHFRDLTTPVQPILIRVAPNRFDYLFVRLEPGALPGAAARLRADWEDLAFAQPFEFTSLDGDIDAVYKSFADFGRIALTATGFAVLIACLGLFGLAVHAVQRRTKEIGIRKVLGSSVAGIVVLLSRDFLALVLLANILGWPLAYVFIRGWLRNFAVRVPVGAGPFLVAGLAAFALALATVIAHAVRAALAPPVASIRYE
ncbi:MAG: ABC transporter permease [Candidatus Aminicenantes bacterium]|nr:ABC transporter permease [Candidatus Aminicenantes bacterium]